MLNDHTSPARAAEPAPPPGQPLLVWGLVVIVVSAALLGFVIFFEPPTRDGDGEQGSGAGQELADFRLQEARTLREFSFSEFRGKTVLINLWGPWCTNCRIEMPELHDVYKQYRNRDDFAFVSLTCSADFASEDPGPLLRESQNYFAEKGFEFPLYLDPHGSARATLVQLLHEESPTLRYPFSLLIGPEGEVISLWVGYHPDAASRIQAALAASLDRLPSG